MAGIHDYLWYMEKMADISPKYTWESLLTYDCQYRIWQALEAVTWGTDNVHLINAHALPRIQLPHARSKQSTGSRPPTKPSNPLCKQYNM